MEYFDIMWWHKHFFKENTVCVLGQNHFSCSQCPLCSSCLPPSLLSPLWRPPSPHLVILWVGLQQAVLLDGHRWRQRYWVSALLAFLLSAALHAWRTGLWQGAAGQALITNPLQHTQMEKSILHRTSTRRVGDIESMKDCVSTHLLHSLILRCSGAVVWVFLGPHRHLPALPHLAALLVLVGQFLHMAVCLAAA